MLNRVFLDAAAGYDNPNALYMEGREAGRLVENVKKKVAKTINTDSSHLFITPSASLANYFLLNKFRTVISSTMEHPSISSHRHVKKILKVDKNGRIIAEKMKADLVSVALANHEVGTIQNVAAVKAMNPDILLHSDATAAFGKIEIDLSCLPVDFMTFSGSKLGAHGVAFLYCRDIANAPELPVGTPNMTVITKLNELLGGGIKMVDCSLRDRLRDKIVQTIPDVIVNTPQENSLPNLLNVSFIGAEGESIMLMLDEAGIAVSTGSACLLGKPSPTILAMSGDSELAHNSVRFSLDARNTAADIDAVISVLPNIIKRLRRISTR